MLCRNNNLFPLIDAFRVIFLFRARVAFKELDDFWLWRFSVFGLIRCRRSFLGWFCRIQLRLIVILIDFALLGVHYSSRSIFYDSVRLHIGSLFRTHLFMLSKGGFPWLFTRVFIDVQKIKLLVLSCLCFVYYQCSVLPGCEDILNEMRLQTMISLFWLAYRTQLFDKHVIRRFVVGLRQSLW